MKSGTYQVSIRRAGLFSGLVRPEAEQLEGKRFAFTVGWLIEPDESDIYGGEFAMIPRDFKTWPDNAPTWIASGDLKGVNVE